MSHRYRRARSGVCAGCRPEPGGLSPRDIIATLQRLQGRVVAADLVEVNPTTDIHDLTANVAVKLLRELVGVLARS
jgi:arginase family enzyme